MPKVELMWRLPCRAKKSSWFACRLFDDLTGEVMKRLSFLYGPLAVILAMGLQVAPASAQQASLEVTRTEAVPATQPIKVLTQGGVLYLQNVDAAQKQLDLAVNLVNATPTVRAAYMGIGVEPPSATLRSQLKLP